MIKSFFKKTHYFWVISRLALIILFLFGTYEQFSSKSKSSLIVSGFFLIIIIWMLTIAIMEFLKKEVKMPIKVLTGVFSISFGLLISYLLLTIGEENYSLLKNLGFQLMPIWIILYGLWEINSVKSKSNEISS